MQLNQMSTTNLNERILIEFLKSELSVNVK